MLVQIVKPEVHLSGLSKRIAERDRFFAAGREDPAEAGLASAMIVEERPQPQPQLFGQILFLQRLKE